MYSQFTTTPLSLHRYINNNNNLANSVKASLKRKLKISL